MKFIFSKPKPAKPKPAAQSEETIAHPTLGAVTLRRTPKARRISISVRPPRGHVRVVVPMRGSARQAMQFLDTKLDWVAAAQTRVRQRAEKGWPGVFHNNAQEGPDGALGIEAVNASGSALMDSAAQRAQIERWRRDAKMALPPRVEQLAAEHGFRYGTVAVRNTVSKWGSCSARGDISLSLHLMRLPVHLADYVILHELCHTVHHNHGTDFHALLSAVTAGRHPILRKELRQYNPRF